MSIDAGSCGALPALPAVPANARLVTEFGAVPNDNIADDTAIANALAALRPNEWLVFPAGRYIQSRSVLVTKAGVTLWGYGATLHATDPNDQTLGLRADGVRVYGFTLTAATLGRGTTPQHTRVTVFRDASQAGLQTGNVVRNVTVTSGATAETANSTSGAGIFVYRARNFTIAENTVRRSLADAIHITAGSRNGRVVGNLVRESGDDMIAMVSYLGSGWQQRIKTDAAFRAAVETGNDPIVSNVLVQGNDLADQYWGRGISVIGGRNITIRQNLVANSTYAAGVIVAQEGGYASAGSRNVLVANNQVSRVQVSQPPYVPQGSAFADLRARIAAGQKTGHGGVEIHAIQNAAADIADAALYPAISLSDVRVVDNQVTDTRNDGIRVGVDTPANLLQSVSLVGNKLSRIGGTPVRSLMADQAKVLCSSNLLDGVLTGSACTAAAAPVPSGASLDCALLP